MKHLQVLNIIKQHDSGWKLIDWSSDDAIVAVVSLDLHHPQMFVDHLPFNKASATGYRRKVVKLIATIVATAAVVMAVKLSRVAVIAKFYLMG